MQESFGMHSGFALSPPFKCRQSIYFDDTAIRDLVFKGYVVVYKISDESIDVFGLTKYQATPVDEPH